MKPYTYLIGWPEQDLWYYGVRYANNCHPNDFWVTYKTSSDKVKEAIIEHGEPTIKQIRKTFADKMIARLWEERVLKRMKVVSSDKWLNQHDSLAPPINVLGNLAMRRPELRKRASNNNRGSKNPMFGKKQEQMLCEHCNTEYAANTYALWHGDRCEKINPEYKENITALRSGQNSKLYGTKRDTVPCQHCGKIVGVNNHARWHGNNCKMHLTRLVANTDLDVYNN